MLPLSLRAATQLTCVPSTVHFGNVVTGQSETAEVVLTNSGQTSVTVSAINWSGPQFAASAAHLPLIIPAGQSASVNVTFSPSTIGWTPGTVTFTSNAPDPALQLSVRGTGVTSNGLGASPSTVSFGQVRVGASSTLPVVLTNLRSYKVRISAFQATGGGFSVSGPALPITLSAGQSITLRSTFAPPSAVTSAGSVFISGPNLNVPLSGTGTTTTTAGQLSVAPAPLNFGNVTVGTTATQAITLSASAAAVTVSADTSSNSQFALVGTSLPVTISAGQSKTYNVSFKPSGSGTASGSLSFTSNASNSPTVSLSGTGITTAAGQLSVAPIPLNFGNVTVGTTGTQAVSLRASGASVTVSSDASTSSQFVLVGASLPFTIPAGQSKSYNVLFTPTGSGTVSGALSFVSNASNSKVQESLTGIGMVQQHSVNLSWNASAGVAGYNVYRSTSANGTYSKINSATDPNTAYTDSSVASGQTYYYEATAVSSSGQESARSTPPVQASIP